jgi:hypothetical protein
MVHDDRLTEGRDGVMREKRDDNIAEILRRFQEEREERGCHERRERKKERGRRGERGREGGGEVVDGRGFAAIGLAALARGNVEKSRGEVESEVVLEGWQQRVRVRCRGGAKI